MPADMWCWETLGHFHQGPKIRSAERPRVSDDNNAANLQHVSHVLYLEALLKDELEQDQLLKVNFKRKWHKLVTISVFLLLEIGKQVFETLTLASCYGSMSWLEFSEKDRLIISSTLRASISNRFRIL